MTEARDSEEAVAAEIMATVATLSDQDVLRDLMTNIFRWVAVRYPQGAAVEAIECANECLNRPDVDVAWVRETVEEVWSDNNVNPMLQIAYL